MAFIGGGFAGLVTGARLKQAGVDDVRIIEKGGDFGGTWYWNRYPGASATRRRSSTCRCSKRPGTCPPRSTPTPPRSSSTAGASPSHFDLYDDALFSTEVTDVAVGRRLQSLDRPHQPGRRAAGPLRDHGHRPAPPAQAARHPRHRDLRRAQLPHQPVGLRLHRRRSVRRADGPPRPTSGSASSAPAPRRCSASRTWPGPAASCTCSSARPPPSTSATTCPSTRSGSRPSSRAGRTSGCMNFTTLQTGGFVDEDLVKDGWTDIAQRIRDKVLAMARDRVHRRDHAAGVRRQRRREDGRDPGPRRRDRRRPRHRRGAQAVVPPAVQAALLPRRVPRRLQRPERHARRHRRQGRRADHRDGAAWSTVPTASSTSSTA